MIGDMENFNKFLLIRVSVLDSSHHCHSSDSKYLRSSLIATPQEAVAEYSEFVVIPLIATGIQLRNSRRIVSFVIDRQPSSLIAIDFQAILN